MYVGKHEQGSGMKRVVSSHAEAEVALAKASIRVPRMPPSAALRKGRETRFYSHKEERLCFTTSPAPKNFHCSAAAASSHLCLHHCSREVLTLTKGCLCF